MGGIWWVFLPLVLGLLAGLAFGLRPLLAARREARFTQARRSFHWQREHLEARFVHISQLHRKPGSPLWVDCDFCDDVSYVRNRYTGELSAFVAVTILLEVPRVTHDEEPAHDENGIYANDCACGEGCQRNSTDLDRTVREATAVFRFGRDRWETDGRAIFNLSPSETIRFYQHDLEMVGQELAGQR